MPWSSCTEEGGPTRFPLGERPPSLCPQRFPPQVPLPLSAISSLKLTPGLLRRQGLHGLMIKKLQLAQQLQYWEGIPSAELHSAGVFSQLTLTGEFNSSTPTAPPRGSSPPPAGPGPGWQLSAPRGGAGARGGGKTAKCFTSDSLSLRSSRTQVQSPVPDPTWVFSVETWPSHC